MNNTFFQSTLKISILFAAFFSIFSTANAAGVLDKNFGTNGVTSVGLITPTATVIQPDGKIIVVGAISGSQNYSDITVIRLNSNGTLDVGFGNNGKVIITTSPYNEAATAVALAPDGKIVIAGHTVVMEAGQTDFLVVRLTGTGSPDTSFGVNGISTVNQGSNDFLYSVAVQTDGKIVAAGRTSDGNRTAAILFNTNGSLDGSFADGGLFFYKLSPTALDEKFLAVALFPNGRILLGGTAFDNLGTDILVMLEPNGTLAQDFGNSGVILEFSTAIAGNTFDLAVLSDGKFLALSRLALRRFLSNGANDPTFRSLYTGGGLDTTAAGSRFALRSDGRIIVLNQRSNSFYTVAYDNNGREISRFRHTPQFTSYSDVVVQGNDKFIIVGFNGTETTATRYLSINSPATRIADFDYDEKTDLAVSRMESNVYVLRSSQNVVNYMLFRNANEGVRPIPEDFYSNNPEQFPLFYQRYSSPNATAYFDSVTENGNRTSFQWGISSDIPVGGDYDGETLRFNSLFRKSTELAIFRPSTGTWWIYNRLTNTASATQWGTNGDKPVPADYDYDGKTDYAVYRPSTGTWWIRRSSDGGSSAIRFGIASDIPLTGDFDGDGKADFTVYRASEGNWYQLLTTEGFRVVRFGISTDSPVPGDYDGDGKHDIAVFRDGIWYISQSTDGLKVVQWGISGDSPIAVRYDR